MIPKKIHYCWIGGNPLPDSAKKCIKSWKKYCPDYEIIEWNESNYDFTKNPYMKQALDAKKWGFVPDFARLDIIYREGGIYLDTDVEMVKPFDPLLSCKGFAGFESEREVALGLGFGAEPGNLIIHKLMESYADLSFLNPDGSLNLTPAPALNSEALEKLGLRRDGSHQELDGFVFLPTEYLCPKSYVDGLIHKTENTYSIHHYDASWFDEKKQAEKRARWKQKKRRAREKKIRGGIHKVVAAVIGEKRYKKLRGVDHDGAKSE